MTYYLYKSTHPQGGKNKAENVVMDWLQKVFWYGLANLDNSKK